MNVASFCSTDVITADATDTLFEAAQKMARNHVGALAVMDEGHLAGVISEADLVAAVAEDASVFSVAVEDYMTEEPITVEGSDDAGVAARRMVEHGIGHLLVLDAGSPVGMVSKGDLLAIGAVATPKE